MIQYKNISNPTIHQVAILDIYNNVGWTNYTKSPEILFKGINASLCTFAAFDNDNLVGLIRVIGDGQTIIYIQDILVKKAYQQQGIGQQLLKLIVKKYEHVRQKVLMTDNRVEVLSFYEKCSFQQMEALNLVGFVKIER
ncbi:MAG: GNAT family N-acetyltransferase [Saprospiraceae bacterium]